MNKNRFYFPIGPPTARHSFRKTLKKKIPYLVIYLMEMKKKAYPSRQSITTPYDDITNRKIEKSPLSERNNDSHTIAHNQFNIFPSPQ